MNALAPLPFNVVYELPIALNEQGGWLNPDIAFWFENYARTCFKEFGDRVKLWITINEPWVVANAGYSVGEMTPGMKGPGILEYKAAHNLIRSHAKAYRIYQNEFLDSQAGIFQYVSPNHLIRLPF